VNDPLNNSLWIGWPSAWFFICPLSSESFNLSSIFRNCPLFLLKCPLLLKIRPFTLDKMDSSAEPKKKPRNKKFDQKVDILIEKFSVLYFFKKYLVTLSMNNLLQASKILIPLEYYIFLLTRYCQVSISVCVNLSTNGCIMLHKKLLHETLGIVKKDLLIYS